MIEILIDLPLFDEAAIAIKEKGFFETKLNSAQLKNLMKQVIASLLDSNKSEHVHKVEIQKLDVPIGEKSAELDSEIYAEITGGKILILLKCTLENDGNDDTKIEKTDFNFDWDLSKSDTFAIANVRGFDVEGVAEKVLDNINDELLGVLRSQLGRKGVTPNRIELHFTENTLNLKLTGSGK